MIDPLSDRREIVPDDTTEQTPMCRKPLIRRGVAAYIKTESPTARCRGRSKKLLFDSATAFKCNPLRPGIFPRQHDARLTAFCFVGNRAFARNSKNRFLIVI